MGQEILRLDSLLTVKCGFYVVSKSWMISGEGTCIVLCFDTTMCVQWKY